MCIAAPSGRGIHTGHVDNTTGSPERNANVQMPLVPAVVYTAVGPSAGRRYLAAGADQWLLTPHTLRRANATSCGSQLALDSSAS